MKRFLSLFAVVSCLFSSVAFAQGDPTSFVLRPLDTKIRPSRYRSIQVIDDRPDTTSMGFVLRGAFNRKSPLVPMPDLQTQFSNILRPFGSNTGATGSLLFHLRYGTISEVTGMSESGTGSFYADLYAVEQDTFRKLATLDTTIAIRNSMMDVTDRMLIRSSDALVDFLTDHLDKVPAPNAFAIAKTDFGQLEAFEKRTIPLYVQDTLTDGVYADYKAFASQKPTAGIQAKWKNGKPVNIHEVNPTSGETEPFYSSETYAVVFEGKPFIITRTGIHPLVEIQDRVTGEISGFSYQGRLESSPNTGAVVASSIAFGFVGGLVASSIAQDKTIYTIQLHHLNGSPIVTGKNTGK